MLKYITMQAFATKVDLTKEWVRQLASRGRIVPAPFKLDPSRRNSPLLFDARAKIVDK